MTPIPSNTARPRGRRRADIPPLLMLTEAIRCMITDRPRGRRGGGSRD